MTPCATPAPAPYREMRGYGRKRGIGSITEYTQEQATPRAIAAHGYD